MAIPRKRSKKRLYIALLLIVLLIVSVAAVAYAAWPRAKVATVGVHVGDSFTYSITGVSTLQSDEATVSPGFEQFNQTDYYRVTITGVTGANVSLSTVWRFLNGTEVAGQQIIDLSTGKQNIENGFWAIYSSNLDIGDNLRPDPKFDQTTVNDTAIETYVDSTRDRNFWFIENQFEDIRDPTHSTLMYVYNGIYFDKQTGMLDTLNNVSSYNNPLKTETITWKLVSCTVWNV